MAKQEKDDAAKEAEGLMDRVAQSLGLLEIIVGAGVAYWAKLWYDASVTVLFTSTGFQVVDIGLLVVVAAVLGKLLVTLAELLMALAALLLWERGKHYKSICQWIKDNYSIAADKDFLEIGKYVLFKSEKSEQAYFDNLRNKALGSYSMAQLSLLFVFYFFRGDAPGSILGFSIAATVAFIWIGSIHQYDIYKILDEKLSLLNVNKTNHGTDDSSNH